MKGFAVVLLCALAAAQARNTAVQPTASSTSLAALGENPWLVHLRMAVSTGGLLKSCAGVLIDSAWVLTSASCVDHARFIWIRYGTVTVINPSLVTETSAVVTHPGYNPLTGQNDIALVRINRVISSNENISSIALSRDPAAPLPASGKFCGFGASEQGGPGEQLSCSEVLLQRHGDQIVANSVEGLQTTDYDLGAPVVSDGVLLGVRNNWFPGLSAGVFVSPANYIDWISSVSGIQF